jgi:hypothetical protein
MWVQFLRAREMRIPAGNRGRLANKGAKETFLQLDVSG